MPNNNNTLKFSDHDYSNIKKNLREFLANQTVLSDYDIDASVLDVMLSTLAYDRQANSITANAMFAELISITTATNRKNIVLHAKNHSYTPHSVNSSKATVDITVTTDLLTTPPSQLTIPKGAVLTGVGEDDTYRFVTNRSYTADLQVDHYDYKNVDIYQGEFGSVDIFIDKNNNLQTYDIDIDDIDTNFLEVYVQDSIDTTSYTLWDKANDSINVYSDSKVYFLQESINGRFALEFGDDVLGKAVANNINVRVVYLKSVGAVANGIREFNFSYSPDSFNKLNNASYSTVITTIGKAAGGFEAESDESVKKNAPKFFVSQNRGVTPLDYEDLLRVKFPFINSISAWSGEEGKGLQDQFGRIYVSANTSKSQFLTDAQKQEIVTGIKEKFGMGAVIPVLIDVDNTYIDLDIDVFVKDFVFLTSSEVEDLVRGYIEEYNENNLEQFQGKFEHSQFVSGIDILSDVISSNITEVKLQKRIFPDTRVQTSFNLTFHNTVTDLTSNSFVFGDNLKTVFMKAISSGMINIYEIINGSEILVKENVGQIDFKLGDISVKDITIFKTNDITKDIRFFATPSIENITSSKNNICVIDTSNIKVTRE